jgi:hypothetical protein
MELVLPRNAGAGIAATCLVASFSGCGMQDEQYVDFRDTMPAATHADASPGMTDTGPQQSTDSPVDAHAIASEVSAPVEPGRTLNQEPAVDPPSPDAASLTQSAELQAGPSESQTGPSIQPVSSAVPETTDLSEPPNRHGESSAGSSVVSSKATDTIGPVSPGEVTSAVSGLTGPADVPIVDNAAPTEARPIQLLVPEKRFRRERGTDAVRVSYDDLDLLKVLNMDPVPPNATEYFPDWLSHLDGKPIRIRGFMYPEFVTTGITTFTLARDNAICCFQRMPKVYDVILVKLAEGESTDYIDLRPFDVEGTLRFDNSPDATELPRLYRIENARVLQ